MSNEMKEIDWSKAPEGATHFDTRGNCCSIGFMKPGVRRGEWEYFGMDGHWILYGPVDSAMEAAMIKRPADTPWTGEGLPPVGAVCEAWHNGCAQGVVQVRYSGGCMVLWNVKLKHEQCSASENYTFKPIRTPEQIAAEEREKAIEEMARIGSMADTPRIMAAKLYDAGCRMVTP